MLVLALQFSKGDAPGSPAIRMLSRTTTEQLDHQGACTGAVERAVGQTLMPCVAEGERTRTTCEPAPSKRKRRPCQPMRRREEDGSYDTRCFVDRHVSAPTGNWFEPGQDECLPRLNDAP